MERKSAMRLGEYIDARLKVGAGGVDAREVRGVFLFSLFSLSLSSSFSPHSVLLTERVLRRSSSLYMMMFLARKHDLALRGSRSLPASEFALQFSCPISSAMYCTVGAHGYPRGPLDKLKERQASGSRLLLVNVNVKARQTVRPATLTLALGP